MRVISLGFLGSRVAKITIFFIIISFVLTPLYPVFAQEIGPENVLQTAPNPTEEIIVPSSNETPGSTPETLIENQTSPVVEEPAIQEETPPPQEEEKLKEEELPQALDSISVPPELIGRISDFTNTTRLTPGIDNLTGALVYEYKVNVPPGRNKMTPEVALRYNSANASSDSIIGSGWELTIPSIQRVNKKGSDKLYTENYFISSFDGELISTSTGIYAAKNENGNFIKYVFTDNIWTVTDKEGTVYKFGNTADARQDNSADTTKVFKWMLEEVRDTNDNYISYEYYKDAGQIYPSKITYSGNGSTPGVFEVNFVRENRTNAPTFYNTGFSIKSNYRISEIRTEVSDVWAHKYTLAYTVGDNASGSFLNTIVESGQDDSSVTTTLPAINFDYNTSTPGWTHDSSLSSAFPIGFMYDNKDYGMRTADINGDGLIDILCSAVHQNGNACGSANNPKIYLNTGTSWADVSTTWLFPTDQQTPTKLEAFVSANAYNYMDNDMVTTYRDLQIMDVNGDGLNDLVRTLYSDNYDNKYVYLNTGSGWVYDSTLSSSFPLGFMYSNFDYGLRTADINGDGFMDILCSAAIGITNACGSADHPRIFLNNGSGWTDVSTTWLFPADQQDTRRKEAFISSSDYMGSGMTSNSRDLQIMDVNGDGLNDLVRTLYSESYNNKYVYLNTGSGWVYDSTLSSSFPLGFMYGNFDYGMRTADINGDNFVDILCSAVTGVSYNNCGASDNTKSYLNTGSGWTDVSNTWIFPVDQQETRRKEAFVSSSDYMGSNMISTSKDLHIIDINGDGLNDLVRAMDGSSYNYKYVYLNNNTEGVNYLSSISYPQGGTTTITYQATPMYKDSSSNLLNPHIPVVIDVVSQINTSDGLGNTEAHTYEYQGGEYYFGTYPDRKFSGFNKITDTDSAGNVKKIYYHQGNTTDTALGEYDDHVSKIGIPYRSEEYDDSGHIYKLTVDKIDKYNIGTDHNFVKTIRHTTLDYDGDNDHADTASEYTYDNTYGNVTQQNNWGKVTASTDGSFTDIGNDKLTEDISYVTNTNNYVVGLPYQDTATDQSANKVRETKTYYDTQSLGTVTDGNLTKVEDWIVNSTYINNQKTYDGTYGLVATTTDPRGKVTTYASYDTYNLYPTTITNPLSQTVQYTYDYSLGKPKQTTNQNGFVYQTTYDGLDRVTAEKIPDFTSPYSAITKTAYTYTDTSGAVNIQRTDYLDSSTSRDTYQYFDGLGRLIQERKEAESNYNVRDTVYNNIGLVEKQSLPYTSSGSSKTSATGTTSLYATNTYDPLKRILSTDDATGTTSYIYDDWKTTVTDKNNNEKSYYKDAYNNLVQVDEVNGSSTYTTNYEWNLNNKLTKITDALSNIRNFTYDGLGRRLTAEDLHASGDGTYGTWTYTYDDAGNITQTVSPRSLTTNYTYNDINQQLTEDYTGVGGTEITYTYSGCTNGTGKLCSVTMTSGANTSYTYDSNGNVASEAKTINSATYTTSYTYDRQGNKLIITYPDNAEVRYTFNTAGLLEKIERKESGGSFSDIVSNFDYSPLNQITTQADVNSVTTTNAYDASHLYRLTSKQTPGNIGHNVPPTNHAPVITLAGSDRYDLNVGDTWTEPGYSATDTEDGTITGSVTVTGSVNTAVAGTYQVMYNVADMYDVPATTKIRTVVIHVTNMTVKALVIGGGGYGGQGGGGGGGAGGYQENSALTVNTQAYTVTVGAGGIALSATPATGSFFGSLISTNGGGAGGSGSGGNGSNGGSAGGAGYPSNSGGTTGGTGTVGQGNNGGNGFWISRTSKRSAGGGGGGSAIGAAGADSAGGVGGAGLASSITGTSITRAGGGGGSSNAGTPGAGGAGGGGAGKTNATGDNATANTGSGGGGGGANGGGFYGGNGGSGVVIIAYHADGSDGVYQSSTGGTITTSGGYRIHTFTSSGTFTAVSSTANNIPVITLTGSDRYDKNIGDTWTEPGYSATDTEDGTITGSVTVTGSVNTAVAGTYQLVYSVVDSGGGVATRKIRTVFVIPGSTSGYIQKNAYTYDNNGNITKIIDTSDTGSTKTADYVYDDLNRMISATITAVASGQSTYTHTYTYDAIGNISTGPVGSYTYAGTGYANPHAATSINGVTYSYDNDGNLTGNGTLANTWNHNNQLTQSVVGGTTNTYTYDYLGERASTSDGTTTTVYPNDSYNTNGSKITKQVYDNNRNLIATIETVSGTVTPYYNHTDHLGSITATSDSSGALSTTLDYFPFGAQRITSGPTMQRQYIGELYDNSTSLQYLNARYMKSDIGKFISQDPMFWALPMELLIDPQQQNSYSYARNNPIIMKDPSGNITLQGAINAVKKAISSWFGRSSSNAASTVTSNSNSNSGTKLVPYSGSNFTGKPVQANSNFIGGLKEINSIAQNNNVMVNVTSSGIRNVSTNLPGAIVPSSDRSNHYIGSAIDMNVVSGETGQNCNSSCLGTNKMSKDVSGFIKDVSSSPNLRWGGEWKGTNYDPVHIDNGYNVSNFEGWKAQYELFQGFPYQGN